MARGTVVFNVTTFRAQFPAFSDAALYPDAMLRGYFDDATLYITNRANCLNGLNTDRLTRALYLLTAHITELNRLLLAGDTGSQIVSNATIDKVSVQVVPPPEGDQWDWWLNQTPYGAQLLALLTVVAAGGFYYGGAPETGALRRVGGMFGFRWLR